MFFNQQHIWQISFNCENGTERASERERESEKITWQSNGKGKLNVEAAQRGGTASRGAVKCIRGHWGSRFVVSLYTSMPTSNYLLFGAALFRRANVHSSPMGGTHIQAHTRIHTHIGTLRHTHSKGQKTTKRAIRMRLFPVAVATPTQTHSHTHTHTTHTHLYTHLNIHAYNKLKYYSGRKQGNWHCGAPYHANARHSPEGSCLPLPPDTPPPTACLPASSLALLSVCVLFVICRSQCAWLCLCVCASYFQPSSSPSTANAAHVRLPVMLSSPQLPPLPTLSPSHL